MPNPSSLFCVFSWLKKKLQLLTPMSDRCAMTVNCGSSGDVINTFSPLLFTEPNKHFLQAHSTNAAIDHPNWMDLPFYSYSICVCISVSIVGCRELVLWDGSGVERAIGQRAWRVCCLEITPWKAVKPDSIWAKLDGLDTFLSDSFTAVSRRYDLAVKVQ